MAETVTLRVEKSLMERIDSYAKSKEIKRSEAMRSLIDLGLKVNDIRGDEASKIDYEMQQMIIEIFIRQNQNYLLNLKDISNDKLQDCMRKVKENFKEKFPNSSNKYNNFLFPDEAHTN